MRTMLQSLHIHARKNSERVRQEQASKAFYLIAEPGYPNYGDELIAGEWLTLLGEYYPEVPVVVDCARPGPAAVILRDRHPHAIFTDTLRRLGTENPFPYDGPIDDIACFVSQALDDDGVAPNYASGIRLLQHGVQSIHMLGGGYMRGDWTCNLSRMAIGPWAHARNIPVAATGLGLMPIEGDSLRFAQQTARSFDVFTVRDIPTQVALRGEPAVDVVKVAPDDCFVNGLKDCYASPEGLPDVMVCVQSDFVEEEAALFEQVRRTLEAWGVNKDDAIGVVECNPRIDYPILPYLAESGYSNLRFFPVIDLLEKGFPARAGQRWLSTRYHPHILAAAKGCSGSFISVDSGYYDVKHDAVIRMGSHWTRNTIGEEVPSPGQGFVQGDLVKEYADEIRRNVHALYPRIPSAANR